MTITSPLKNIHSEGLFGDYKDKDERDLIKISEIKNLLIVQIAQYKNSSYSIRDIKLDNLNIKNEPVLVSNSNETRILWNGPNNWLVVSSKKELINEIFKKFDENNFAITDLSNSRTIVELEGKNIKEVLKKGCPYNFNELKKNNCLNSVFNGMTITIDMLDENPYKIRVFTLRSFGESFYHSITDASLEFGYKNI